MQRGVAKCEQRGCHVCAEVRASAPQAAAHPHHDLPSSLNAHLSHTNSVCCRASPKAQTVPAFAAPPVLPARSRLQVYLCDWEVERGLGLDRERSYTHDDSKMANAAAQSVNVCVCSVAHYDDLHACIAVTIVITICVSS